MPDNAANTAKYNHNHAWKHSRSVCFLKTLKFLNLLLPKTIIVSTKSSELNLKFCNPLNLIINQSVVNSTPNTR